MREKGENVHVSNKCNTAATARHNYRRDPQGKYSIMPLSSKIELDRSKEVVEYSCTVNIKQSMPVDEGNNRCSVQHPPSLAMHRREKYR